MNTKTSLVTLIMIFSLMGCGKKNDSVNADLNSTVPAKTTQATISWYTDWDTGMAEAKKNAKPVFVEFYADWCVYCKKMDKETFAAPEIEQRLSNDWVCIKIDTEARNKSGSVYIDSKANETFTYFPEGIENIEEKTLPNNQLIGFFGGRGIPTLLFIDKTGKTIYPHAGFIPKEQFGPMLDYFRDELYSKNVNLGEYIKSKR